MIPEWLLQKDDYTPKEEKNLYVEKSIFSLIKIVSNIKENRNCYKSNYFINPTLKVMTTILIIILISVSRDYRYLMVIDLYVLIHLFFMKREVIKSILFKSFIFPVITLIALIPSMLYGNITNSLLIFQKLIVSMMLMNLLAHSTKWNDINKSLKLIFVPDMFIWIMDITIKYIVLLGEHSINLLYSLKLRAIGITANKYKALTGVIGNLFIKSYKTSEEMFNAMECRGFVGEYKTKANLKFRKVDYIYLMINAMLIVAFIYLN